MTNKKMFFFVKKDFFIALELRVPKKGLILLHKIAIK
jgi:hypothetical protein